MSKIQMPPELLDIKYEYIRCSESDKPKIFQLTFKEPSKTYEKTEPHIIERWSYNDEVSIKDILKFIQEDGVSVDEVKLSWEFKWYSDDSSTDVKLYYMKKKNEPNKFYEKELAEYQTKKKMYDKEAALLPKLVEIWEQWKKKQKLHNDKQQYLRLKKQLKEAGELSDEI